MIMNKMTHTKLNMKTFQTIKAKLVSTLAVLSALAFSGNVNAVEVVDLLTSESGMHRITHEQLLAQGIDLSGIRHSRLGLTLNDEPVAIFSKGQDDRNLQCSSRASAFMYCYASSRTAMLNLLPSLVWKEMSGR